MNAKKVFYGLLAISFVFLGLIIGTAILGDVLFKKQSEELSELKAKNEALDQQSSGLIKAKQDIEQYNDLNETVKKIVPQDKDQAKTIREINRIAVESGVTLSQISFDTSTLGDKKPAALDPTTGEALPSPSQSQVLTQVVPVTGIPGVFSLGITVQNDENNLVPYERFLTFLEKLESNRRTAHVEQIKVTPTDDGQSVSFSLVLNAYVKP